MEVHDQKKDDLNDVETSFDRLNGSKIQQNLVEPKEATKFQQFKYLCPMVVFAVSISVIRRNYLVKRYRRQ